MMLFGAAIGTMMTVGTLGVLHLLAGLWRISKPPGWRDQINCGAQPLDDSTCSTSKEMLSDRCDPSLYPLDAAYPLSYRHLEEMMEQGGVSVDYSSI